MPTQTTSFFAGSGSEPAAAVPPTLGLVLAGGRATRLGGGDKGFRSVGGRTILSRVLDRLSPCAAKILNANGDPARFSGFGLPVVADDVPGFCGPLAGVLAGLDWAAAHRPDLAHVISAPADCPFLPADLVATLYAVAQKTGRPLACAGSGGRRHPVVALWPVALRAELRRAVVDEKFHKVGAWMDRHGVAVVDWTDTPFDPFLNVNTPEDFSAAERIAATHPAA